MHDNEPGSVDETRESGPARRWPVSMTDDGTPTLVHPVLGEACHSQSGAWSEARARYSRACRLSERPASCHPIRLMDIGTGPGWNLAAALDDVEGAGGTLEAASFELDADVLRETLVSFEGRVQIEAHALVRKALASALARGSPVPLGVRSRLHLHLGDARETLPRLAPEPLFDAVFLDPFSPRVAPELWRLEFLREITRRMASGSWLATYSTSLDVSAALFAAGLRVGRGPRVGNKSGSLASPDLTPPALPERVQRKIERRALSLLS